MNTEPTIIKAPCGPPTEEILKRNAELCARFGVDPNETLEMDIRDISDSRQMAVITIVRFSS